MSTQQSIVELYRAYKDSTKYVQGWLLSACSPDTPRHFKSTTEIVNAAMQIRQQNLPVPSSIISSLRDAIKKRKKVLDIYKPLISSQGGGVGGDSNFGHEVFVERLEQVLQILLPLGTTPQPQAKPLMGQVGIEMAPNRFAILNDAQVAKQPDQIEQVTKAPDSISSPTTVSAKATPPLPPAEPSPDAALLLQDDDIGEWIELSLFLQELDAISACLDASWEEAAKGEIPIAFAAWLSTTALHAVGRLCLRIRHIAPTYDDLVVKWKFHMEKGFMIRFTTLPEFPSSRGRRFTEGTGIFYAGQLVHHCRTSDEYRNILPHAGQRQDPRQTISRHTLTRECEKMGQVFQLDDLALDQMQESMRQLLASKRGVAALELSEQDHHISEPLLPLLKQALRDADAPTPTHLVFGMEVLLSTYKAFLWPRGEAKPNNKNCRITALQFCQEVRQAINSAIEMISAIKAVAKAEELVLLCQQLNLQEQVDRLETFQRERRFDLYYQAPWTAGCHMVEILNVGSSTGLALITEIGYVCAVLHLYNALRQLASPIPKITLLDQLCQIFLGAFFQQDLPTDNFCTRYRRAMGQGLEKDTEPGGARFWRLSKPTILSNRRVLFPSQQSLFFELHDNGYGPTNDFWVRVCRNPNIRQPSQPQKHEVLRELRPKTFNILLDKIKAAVLPEFVGNLPIVRLNLFGIFVFCTKILQELGRKVDEAPEIVSRGKGPPLGYAFVDVILGDIVEHLNNKFKKELMPFWRELNMTKSVFEGIESEISVSDYLWAI